MNTELYWLTLNALITALLWIPYILNRIVERGLIEAVLRDPDGNTSTNTGWARRMMAAHVNAVENLAVFAPLVLVAVVAGVSNEWTEFASILFFYSRVAHAVTFTLGMPALIRITAFFGGFIAQMIISINIIS